MAKRQPPAVRGPGGRTPGGIEPLRGDLRGRLREKRAHVYTAVLRGALAPDPHWARLFLELTGDLVGANEVVNAEAHPKPRKAKLTAVGSGPASTNE